MLDYIGVLLTYVSLVYEAMRLNTLPGFSVACLLAGAPMKWLLSRPSANITEYTETYTQRPTISARYLSLSARLLCERPA